MSNKQSKSVHKFHPAVKAQLASATNIPTFLSKVGKLKLDDRKVLVEQALILLEENYAHLPLKKSMHAVDPIQKLKLLKFSLERQTDKNMESELFFHNTMTSIFNSVRDLHTNYFLPAPFDKKIAYLPFMVEDYYENGKRKYLMTRYVAGFSHPKFKPGAEILSWNGVPIDRAVEVNADRLAGSNLEARHARGVSGLTIRPLKTDLPPNEQWAIIRYRNQNNVEEEIKFDWKIFQLPTEQGNANSTSGDLASTALGLDIYVDLIRQAKKVLYVPELVKGDNNTTKKLATKSSSSANIPSKMSKVFSAREIQTSSGKFGYIRIFTFSVNSDDKFLDEFIRLVGLLPQNGLILDVRNNGGGLIYASERLLQILTPKYIRPERVQFLNSNLNYELCQLHSPSKTLNNFDLSPWKDSIAQATKTGATYSRAYPMTSEESCNDIGQKYFGPVVLITNAQCYSATDIFSAGFQDHEIGPILGTDNNTGAGGANVWTHDLFWYLFTKPGTNPPKSLPHSPYKRLPHGAGMRVSIRRTLRVNENSGTPVEDLGVVPDHLHRMSKNDLLNRNEDLMNQAGKLLAKKPAHNIEIEFKFKSNGSITFSAKTKNLTRLDIYVDDRPQKSIDLKGDKNEFNIEKGNSLFSEMVVRGFKKDVLAVSLKMKI